MRNPVRVGSEFRLQGITAAESFVEILALRVEAGAVGDLGAGTEPYDPGGGFASGLVVVKVEAEAPVGREERDGFRDVDDRVQHGDVGEGNGGILHCHEGKEVHEALEDRRSVAAVAEGRDVFRRAAALEPRVAEFPPSRIVREADGEVGFFTDRVAHLFAVRRSDRQGYAPVFQVAY